MKAIMAGLAVWGVASMVLASMLSGSISMRGRNSGFIGASTESYGVLVRT